MHHHCTKAELYREIHQLCEGLNLAQDGYPLDIIQFCQERPDIEVACPCFKTPGLKGISCLSTQGEPNVILLNGTLSWKENNFTCAHELIHITLHKGGPAKSFNCFEKAKPNQDAFLEWQANEGAAEILAPAHLLFPYIAAQYPQLTSWRDYGSFKAKLASIFSVTEAVITYRFESLKYEISQYLAGTPLDRIQFLSASRQRQAGISVCSLNDLEMELLHKETATFKRIHDRKLNLRSIDIHS